ncbi:MAG: molybdopterin-dependent oxidoreductase, partial [Flavobacteriales bacterium]
MDSWGKVAFAGDWGGPPRLQQAPLWHYINTSQYRYDGHYYNYNTVPDNEITKQHTADQIFRAVRTGSMPFFPQFNQNTLELTKEAEENGAQSNEDIQNYVLEKLKNKQLEYSVSEPEAQENHPRVWYIWRGNAIMGSMKGHEYALKHYLGTHSNAIGEANHNEPTKEVKWYEQAPEGKMDLVVDLNFRMDSSALYSDIVLPAASWYEKADLNSTDLHSFIHPLSAAVAPVWESKTDWEIFKQIAHSTSEVAKSQLSTPQKDVVATPIGHDTEGEIAQPEMKDWYKGEIEPIPGQTMHKLAIVERDYTKIYDKYIALGDKVKQSGLGAHGSNYDASDVYDDIVRSRHYPTEKIENKEYPSLDE